MGRCHSIQHNDIQHNDTGEEEMGKIRHLFLQLFKGRYDIHHNDIQQNGIQHNGTQHNEPIYHIQHKRHLA